MNDKDKRLAKLLAAHAIVSVGYTAFLPTDDVMLRKDPAEAMTYAADDYFVHEDFHASQGGAEALRMWQDRRYQLILLAIEEVYGFARAFEEGHRVVEFVWA